MKEIGSTIWNKTELTLLLHPEVVSQTCDVHIFVDDRYTCSLIGRRQRDEGTLIYLL